MSNQPLEMCDVEVVLNEPFAERPETVNILRQHGLTVTNVDRDDGVVEGTISADQLADLSHLESVGYVRVVLEYLADKAATPPAPSPEAD
jgi:hypothetical protein